jgi:hypothetical protein
MTSEWKHLSSGSAPGIRRFNADNGNDNSQWNAGAIVETG